MYFRKDMDSLSMSRGTTEPRFKGNRKDSVLNFVETSLRPAQEIHTPLWNNLSNLRMMHGSMSAVKDHQTPTAVAWCTGCSVLNAHWTILPWK